MDDNITAVDKSLSHTQNSIHSSLAEKIYIYTSSVKREQKDRVLFFSGAVQDPGAIGSRKLHSKRQCLCRYVRKG